MADPSSSSSFYVGEDVVMDILSRLPAKSILRFKCVCKSWYDLIKNPDFIEKHHQRNLINESDASLVFVRSYKIPRSVLWISSSSSSSSSNSNSNKRGAAKILAMEEEVPSIINPDLMPFTDIKQTPYILGPVKGIYCAGRLVYTAEAGRGWTLFLCNPTLREVKSIPELPHPPTSEDKSRKLITGYAEFGFGYDSRNNDFKVVAMRNTEWSPGNTRDICVFLYTLSSNSWRKLDSKNLPAWPSQYPPVFLSHGNGVVYWWRNDNKGILPFDLGTEVFRVLTMPDAFVIKCRDEVYLALLNDSLAAFRKPEPRRNSEDRKEYYYEIWVMEEYAVNKVSWTKLYSIGPFLVKVVRPFRFWNNGEILFEKTENKCCYLVSYDPISQQIQDFHIRYPAQVVTFMESLVSIVGG